MDQQQPPATKPRSRTRLIGQAVFSLALVVVVLFYDRWRRAWMASSTAAA